MSCPNDLASIGYVDQSVNALQDRITQIEQELGLKADTVYVDGKTLEVRTASFAHTDEMGKALENVIKLAIATLTTYIGLQISMLEGFVDRKVSLIMGIIDGIQSLIGIIQNALDSLINLPSRVSALETGLSDLQGEIALKIAGIYLDLGALGERLSISIDNVKTSLTDYINSIQDNIQDSLDNIQDNVKDIERDLNDAKGDIEDAKREIDNLENSQEEQDRRIGLLESKEDCCVKNFELFLDRVGESYDKTIEVRGKLTTNKRSFEASSRVGLPQFDITSISLNHYFDQNNGELYSEVVLNYVNDNSFSTLKGQDSCIISFPEYTNNSLDLTFNTSTGLLSIDLMINGNNLSDSVTIGLTNQDLSDIYNEINNLENTVNNYYSNLTNIDNSIINNINNIVNNINNVNNTTVNNTNDIDNIINQINQISSIINNITSGGNGNGNIIYSIETFDFWYNPEDYKFYGYIKITNIGEKLTVLRDFTMEEILSLLNKIYSSLGGDDLWGNGSFSINLGENIEGKINALYNAENGNPKTITINNLFDAITYNNSATFGRLGLDKLPAEVPKNLNAKIGSNEASETENQLSFLDLWLWDFKMMDARLGKFPVEIEIKDSDLVQEGDQPIKLEIPNLAELCTESLGLLLLLKSLVEADVSTNIRTLGEVGATKVQGLVTYRLLESIQAFLNFKTKQKTVKIEMSYDPVLDDNATISDILKDSEQDIIIEEFDDDKSLTDILAPILQSAAITRAKDFRRFDLNFLKDLFMNSSEALGNDSDFDAFLEKVERGFIDIPNIQNPNNPYGKPYEQRPKIVELGDQSNE